MRHRKTRRVVELVKTILIVVFTLSAVTLVGKVQLNTELPAASDWMERIVHYISGDANATDSPDGQTIFTTDLFPVRIAVCNERGRYGVQYDAETTLAVFEAELGGLLGEALADAGSAYTVSEDEWREALCGGAVSVYYDFLGSVPLSALSGWLGGLENKALTGDVRRLLLAAGGGSTATLYYSGGSDGLYYACTTTVATDSRLQAVAVNYTPNHALFAFQQEDRYQGLNPYVMILPNPPAPVVCEVSNPISMEESSGVMDDLLRGLSFHPQTSAVYPSADDGQVVREGTDTLRISGTGTVTFYTSDSQDPRYPVTFTEDTPTRGEMVAAARALVESSLGVWCGDAGFYLIDTEVLPSGSVAVCFGYLLDGAAVELYEDGYAARVIITDAYISDFTLHFRDYRKTETLCAILPELQAVAAMNALQLEGSELLLCYPDGGGTQVRAGWVAK